MNDMRRVIIESPYSGGSEEQVQFNREFLELCILDSLMRGEAPIASHKMYTDCLNDNLPNDRELGIEAGLAWYQACEAVVFYINNGMSNGMKQAYNYLFRLPDNVRPICEFRLLMDEK